MSLVLETRGSYRVGRVSGSIEFGIALAFVVIFGLVVHAFQYQGELGESDLYRVLDGLMGGAVSGKGIASDLHYDRDFGFGYLMSFYEFADPATLRDPDRLMPLMNQVGFWSFIPALLCFWCAVSLAHGARAATLALIIFALSPMIPELATSGHQVIPMFGFLCAGAVLMFLPVSGWRAVVAAACAAVLLLAGLLMRGEIFLAFPWLVLSGADTRSLRAFLRSVVLRSIAPMLTLLAFFLLQRTFVNTAMGSTVGHYFGEFYSWATVVPGLVYMGVGCGIATVGLALLAVLRLGWVALRQSAGSFRAGGPAALLGPIALVLVPLAFFAPNPQPTRHFMMTLAGLSILIALALTTWPAISRVTALVVVLGIGMVNQVLAEAARPVLMRINDASTPYLPTPDAYRTTTHANLGWEWQRHAALVARRARWHAMGDMLRTSCAENTMILSDEGAQLFSRLYAGGAPVDGQAIKIGPYYGRHGVLRGKTYIVLEKMTGWPKDTVAVILADPAYAKYQLFTDPYTASKYDITPVPADRAAKFGCAE